MITVSFHNTKRMSCTVYYCIENFVSDANTKLLCYLGWYEKEFPPVPKRCLIVYLAPNADFFFCKVCLSVDFREDFDICPGFNFFIVIFRVTLFIQNPAKIRFLVFFFSFLSIYLYIYVPRAWVSLSSAVLFVCRSFSSECLALKTSLWLNSFPGSVLPFLS